MCADTAADVTLLCTTAADISNLVEKIISENNLKPKAEVLKLRGYLLACIKKGPIDRLLSEPLGEDRKTTGLKYIYQLYIFFF